MFSIARRHILLLALAAALAIVVLILTAEHQLYDTNFYSLWEATAILSGDHPYRDFFEWGIPLQALVSAAAQFLVGYRLVGEFLIQWLFIAAGVVISCHLGLRLAHSIVASLVTTLLAVAIIAASPTFHYPKLLFYPLAVWLAWRYMERPSVRRAGALGVLTAMAFLFRHDHGIYIGGVAVLAFGLARLAVPASRHLRSALEEAAAYTVTAAVLVTPWAIVVQANEGLPEYVRARADLYTDWSASRSPYTVLWSMNPIRELLPEPLPTPKPAIVSFEWNPDVDEAQRRTLERRHGLRLLREGGPKERWQYEVPNAYDTGLLGLNSFIDDTQGFEWDRLQRARVPVPTRANAQIWLEQTALLVPLLLLLAGAIDVYRCWSGGKSIAMDTWQMVLAAAFLAVVNARILREASYVVVVAPLTAALGTRLLVGRRRIEPGEAQARNGVATVWTVARWTLALGVLLLTVVTTFAYTRDTYIFQPWALVHTVRPAFEQLLAAPPIDGYVPPEVTRQYTRALWNSPDADTGHIMLRYVHDCTREGDRILVTGQTPYHIGYYAERSIAGGHLFWHHRWRSDPVHEMQSLALLETQSVPFALSTHDPILDDFKRYPRIREYLVQNYMELEGSQGRLLIDRRRQPTGTFAGLGFPCFR